jgi:hypothetical protein
MKKSFMYLFIMLLVFGFAACQNRTETLLDASNASSTATAMIMFERVPEDIPVMEGAFDLRVSSSGNSVTYRVQGIFEDVIKFYQEQTLALGWAQLGGEVIMSDSITMQRTKPDNNMSILISKIQGGDEVLVRVMIASK